MSVNQTLNFKKMKPVENFALLFIKNTVKNFLQDFVKHI